jgi:hydrogenase maturation protease
VERIADAVLHEGYILYPYRPSSVKNQQRWNFGVLCPEPYAVAQSGTESSTMQTECLIETNSSATMDVKVRFLHLMQRDIVNGEKVLQTWQEAVEREVVVTQIRLSETGSNQSVRFRFAGSRTTEPRIDETSHEPAGLIVRTQRELAGGIEISATPVGHQLLKVSITIRNLTVFENADQRSRDDALMRSLVSAHTIVEIQRGTFVSLLDPPENYKAAASGCVNTGTFPVLVGDEGDRNCVLSSPIILYDYPQIAPQSAGNLFDGTEIDEILTLRIMSLTDDEKREMRSADELARQLLERTESLSPEQMMNLHGVMKKT